MGLKENRITVSFPEATKKQLEKVALKKEWSLSQIVREAVKEYLNKEVE